MIQMNGIIFGISSISINRNKHRCFQQKISIRVSSDSPRSNENFLPTHHPLLNGDYFLRIHHRTYYGISTKKFASTLKTRESERNNDSRQQQVANLFDRPTAEIHSEGI